MFTKNIMLFGLPLVCAVAFGQDLLQHASYREEIQSFIDAASKPSTYEHINSYAFANQWLRLKSRIPGERFGSRLYYFVGFIDGKMNVSTPNWWSRELRKGNASPSGFVSFPCRNIDSLWKIQADGWQYSGCDVISVAGHQMVLKPETGDAITLNTHDFPGAFDDDETWNREDDGAIAAAFDNEVCIVGLRCETGGFGGPEDVFCFNRKSKERLWKQKSTVNAIPDFHIGGNVNGSFTEITTTKDHVVLWTCHDYSMGFEIFGKKDGQRVARFASGDLNNIQVKSRRGAR